MSLWLFTARQLNALNTPLAGNNGRCSPILMSVRSSRKEECVACP